MHIHILGICGTFMGSLAILAREQGHTVTGSDTGVYPPMSTQLEAQGIRLMEGYAAAHLQPAPDLVIIGNAMSRGNPAVEYVLEQGLAYTSGPQWLCEHVLPQRHVIAVAGTHGKTTTTTMVAWILEYADLQPGFLIGGVPQGFSASARLGSGKCFVVEADEYDSAFFDKRSKFVHYRPRTAILNNLEFDHADIFDNLAAIQKQFHHLVRIIPAGGRIIRPQNCAALDEVIRMGCWTPIDSIGEASAADWRAEKRATDGSHFTVFYAGNNVGDVRWQQTGEHNVYNALAAIAAAHHVGVDAATACAALSEFGGVKRRMELLAVVNGVSVYDDFAHHPTAIRTTLQGLRQKVGTQKIIAVIEPRSNTMRMGAHHDALAASTQDADAVLWYQPENVNWDVQSVVVNSPVPATLYSDIAAIVQQLVNTATPDTHIVIMSNGGFGGIHQQVVQALRT